MWPTTVMEILFAGAFVSLLADMSGRRSPFAKRYGAGLVVASAVALSIAVLVADWGASLGATVRLQPVDQPFASLYLVDRYTTFTAFTALVVGFAVSVYALLAPEPARRGPFFAIFSILLCSVVGVVSAGDFLTLFLFWEGMTVSAYGLVTIGGAPESMEAGMKYFLMAGIGSLLALYGIGAVYFSTGSIQLQTVTGALGTGFGQLGLALLVLGLGVEAAVVPLHTWLPDVYAGSSIPSASLISGAVTGAAVFGILKVVQPLVPGGGVVQPGIPLAAGAGALQLILASLALLTMLVGNLSALVQGNLRRILSFSSIAQTGYALAAISTLSVAGLVAAVFTIWNNGILKSNMFMSLGGRAATTEGSQLDALRGSGREDGAFGAVFGASTLAMMGAPPFGMFWSEILVVESLLLAGPLSGSVFYALAGAVVLNIVLSIGYYFKMINTVVFGDSTSREARRPRAWLLPSACLLALSLATGVFPFLILGRVL